jgi:hypothetical protein
MIPPAAADKKHPHRSGSAILLLNGEPVGVVHHKTWDASWYFADFEPYETFSRYAPVFGTWSLLMHAEDGSDRLSRDAAEELARAEAALDAIKAQLVFLEEEAPVNIAQLTIDQDKLEWKEY